MIRDAAQQEQQQNGHTPWKCGISPANVSKHRSRRGTRTTTAQWPHALEMWNQPRKRFETSFETRRNNKNSHTRKKNNKSNRQHYQSRIRKKLSLDLSS